MPRARKITLTMGEITALVDLVETALARVATNPTLRACRDALNGVPPAQRGLGEIKPTSAAKQREIADQALQLRLEHAEKQVRDLTRELGRRDRIIAELRSGGA